MNSLVSTLQKGLLGGVLGLVVAGGAWFANHLNTLTISKQTLSAWCLSQNCMSHFPDVGTFTTERLFRDEQALGVQYTVDWPLQKRMQELFEDYSPDYGAFVAMDPRSGRLLAMVSYSKGKLSGEGILPFALRGSFPSASIFKVVTAAAAIEQRNFQAESLISFQGANHTLYRRNVLEPNEMRRRSRWMRQMSLREAFGRSVNTVFGRLGVFELGAGHLLDYARRFGFNRSLGADFPVDIGVTAAMTDQWSIAEVASGFTRHTQMSPLQGALIASVIANEGVMMQPYLIERLRDSDGEVVYQATPQVSAQVIRSETATELKELMRHTVVRGTSQKSFRGFFKGSYAQIDVGGKTGSLTGDSPTGKHDWFVGYADDGKQPIAVAALTIHRDVWKVKSSTLARKAFESRFRDEAVAGR